MTGVEHRLVFEEPPPLQRVKGGRPKPTTRPRRLVTPPDHIAGDTHRPHGTCAKYVMERCRCQPCRQARATYERDRRRAQTRPDETWAPYVPAGPVRQHIQHLADNGIGLKTIARRSGVSHGALWKLVYGKPGRGPSRRVRPDTANKILAVTVHDAADGAKIAAGPTWRVRKEDAACCVARRDDLGRLPIGFCSPDCIRRPA